MAVLQISRIQQRRGLQQDLPQLASAELGWSIDQRRLFIGNGLLGEGAPMQGVTEILTEHTDLIDVIKFYIFKGDEAGYIAQTGPTVSSPTVRSLQDKFDDFVNVRDFGAVGDGATNNIDAVYRALTEIYESNQVVNNLRARRTLYFPGGTFNIGPSPEHPYGVIVIPPWVRIVGDGIDNTHIVQTDPAMDYVIRFSDSSFVYGNTIGATPFIAMPTDISIENLTIKQNNNKDLVLIDNAINVNFKMVQFSGGYDYVTQPNVVYSGIKFNDPAVEAKVVPSNITFEMCKFDNLAYAVTCEVLANNVRFNNCLFDKLYSAIRLGATSEAGKAPSNFRITNSIFRNITSYGISSYQYVTGVVSTGNSYYNVNGTNPAISFQSDGNYSINDYFDTNASTKVSYNDKKVIQLQANVGVMLGTATIGTGGNVTLLTSSTTTSIALPNTGVMNYSISNGTSYRAGTLSFTNNEYVDNFTSDSALGNVTLSVVSNTIHYFNNVSTLYLRYNINHF